jgi:hypothetical protein
MKNLELVYLIKATNHTSVDGNGSTHTYQYELHDEYGQRRVAHVNCGQVDKLFTTLRRKNGQCFGVRRNGGTWSIVDEQTYLAARIEYINN